MEYTINRLARISGVTTRTLRYYDEIGLLKPAGSTEAGYRVYGQREVDALQQILLYRELGFSLDEIKRLLGDPKYDRENAFGDHLRALTEKRKRLDALINNVRQSIAAMKGESTMSNEEKFKAFLKSQVDENEEKYGAEIREKYGDKTVNASNEKFMQMTQEQHDAAARISAEFEEALKAAFETGDPSGELAQRACDLHRQWLSALYPAYTKTYHRGLGEMYVADERFRVNYDKFGAGCTEFLRDAINIYAAE